MVELKRKTIIALIGVLFLIAGAYVTIALPTPSQATTSGLDVEVHYTDCTYDYFRPLAFRRLQTITYAGKVVDYISFTAWTSFASNPSTWNPTVSYSWTFIKYIDTAEVHRKTGTGTVTLSNGYAKVTLYTHTQGSAMLETWFAGYTAGTYTIKAVIIVDYSTLDPYGRPISGRVTGEATITVGWDPAVYEITAEAGVSTTESTYTFDTTLLTITPRQAYALQLVDQVKIGLTHLAIILGLIGIGLIVYAWRLEE